jgi:hypothetical protein
VSTLSVCATRGKMECLRQDCKRKFHVVRCVGSVSDRSFLKVHVTQGDSGGGHLCEAEGGPRDAQETALPPDLERRQIDFFRDFFATGASPVTDF